MCIDDASKTCILHVHTSLTKSPSSRESALMALESGLSSALSTYMCFNNRSSCRLCVVVLGIGPTETISLVCLFGYYVTHYETYNQGELQHSNTRNTLKKNMTQWNLDFLNKKPRIAFLVNP